MSNNFQIDNNEIKNYFAKQFHIQKLESEKSILLLIDAIEALEKDTHFNENNSQNSTFDDEKNEIDTIDSQKKRDK